MSELIERFKRKYPRQQDRKVLVAPFKPGTYPVVVALKEWDAEDEEHGFVVDDWFGTGEDRLILHLATFDSADAAREYRDGVKEEWA